MHIYCIFSLWVCINSLFTIFFDTHTQRHTHAQTLAWMRRAVFFHPLAAVPPGMVQCSPKPMSSMGGGQGSRFHSGVSGGADFW